LLKAAIEEAEQMRDGKLRGNKPLAFIKFSII